MDCIQLSLFGKTYPEHSVPTEEKISGPCWKNLPAWNSQTLQFLDLRRGADGAKPEQSLETDGLWLGDSLTLNIGEKPSMTAVQEVCSAWGPHSAAKESLLSQILEVNAPEKYYLSARACQGILAWQKATGAAGSRIAGNDRPVPILNDQGGGVMGVSYNVTGTLRAAEHGHQPIAFESNAQPVVLESNQIHATVTQTGICPTLSASMGMGGGYIPMVTNKAEKAIHWIVRRLTPTECERLQGYPDGWTDIGEWVDTKGKKHKPADSPRYKALGNSIALPQWVWLVQKMRPYLKEKPTLGSLFDGLGGFPLVWQRAYGEGTARWASEIESFCVAVTKRRFGEE